MILLSPAILVAAAAGLLAWFLLDEGEPEPQPTLPPQVAVEPMEEDVVPEEPASPPEPPALILARIDGRVEIRKGGEGPWVTATEGAALDPADAIRTAPGSGAELSAGDHLIELLPGTDVRIEELTADLSRFLLGTGMVAADARPGENEGRRIQIDVAGTDVTAGTEAGLFRVSAKRNGVVAVGAEEGRVVVAARGREVVLRAGEGTLIRRGQAPADPEPLPESLLLRVAWPEQTETNRTSLAVAGRTAAGALVFVAGRPVEVDEQGRFEAEVRLRDGRNLVSVEGFDVAGNRSVARSPPIVVDTRGSRAKFDTEDLWAE